MGDRNSTLQACDTPITLIERALVLDSIFSMMLVNQIYDVVVDTQFHKFDGRSFARVLHLFLMSNTIIVGR